MTRRGFSRRRCREGLSLGFRGGRWVSWMNEWCSGASWEKLVRLKTIGIMIRGRIVGLSISLIWKT